MATTMMGNANPRLLSDPGGVRGTQARWIIECELRLETATRLGGRDGGPVDMPVLRDAYDGRPLLTGSTLAGALRSFLADRLCGYGRKESDEITRLFGGARGDDLGSQSPLIAFDSYGSLPTGQHVEIRDNVKIDGRIGTAEDHKKFDGEVLPAGTTFPIRLDLLVPGPSDDDLEPPPSEAQLLSLLLAALDGLSSGEITLGARRSRGLGRLSASHWKAKRFDFNTPQGWLDWLQSDAERPLEDLTAHASPQTACGVPSASRPIPNPSGIGASEFASQQPLRFRAVCWCAAPRERQTLLMSCTCSPPASRFCRERVWPEYSVIEHYASRGSLVVPTTRHNSSSSTCLDLNSKGRTIRTSRLARRSSASPRTLSPTASGNARHVSASTASRRASSKVLCSTKSRTAADRSA
jgi:CRISPR/Cas system CSM-associated protein Csm3 (group 7 of RAMP superfamily)